MNAAPVANMLFDLQKSENMAFVLVTHDERRALRRNRRVTNCDGRVVGDERGPHKSRVRTRALGASMRATADWRQRSAMFSKKAVDQL